MKRICVFCGASVGRRPAYRQAAERLGAELAARELTLVYGGGNVGLMGRLADACLQAGGSAIGVIPEALVGREVAGTPVEHSGLTRLEVVDSMHARKARMAELAEGFIALPGGFGTFEELFEILTWAQLGFHQKPIGLLDVDAYFEPLVRLCDGAVNEGFLRPESRGLLLTHTDIGGLLDALGTYRPQPTTPWIRNAQEL